MKSRSQELLKLGGLVDEHAPGSLQQIAHGHVLKVNGTAGHTLAVVHPLLAAVAPLDNALEICLCVIKK